MFFEIINKKGYTFFRMIFFSSYLVSLFINNFPSYKIIEDIWSEFLKVLSFTNNIEVLLIFFFCILSKLIVCSETSMDWINFPLGSV